MLKEKPHAETLRTEASAGVILNGRYLPPPKDADGKQWVRATALVQADPNGLYAMWRDVEKLPLWQEQIASVLPTSVKTSLWVMKYDDKTIEWDSEILAEEPGARIAWRSTSGDSNNAGEVIFEPPPVGTGPW